MKTKKIVNHEIKTQKFNENAKRMKKSHGGMARAFVQISENGLRPKKLGHPWFGASIAKLILLTSLLAFQA